MPRLINRLQSVLSNELVLDIYRLINVIYNWCSLFLGWIQKCKPREKHFRSSSLKNYISDPSQAHNYKQIYLVGAQQIHTQTYSSFPLKEATTKTTPNACCHIQHALPFLMCIHKNENTSPMTSSRAFS